ncbi:hypothetical protein CCR75_005810 [Bremia lactucae]|uniref:Uncharacterized protein n=1 Tax=Bremia lactucae TaxID=4779 RepID=A0A976IES8_BRELC|nr:hypothetical protein CCR75_005810 [Bremia lactucae]
MARRQQSRSRVGRTAPMHLNEEAPYLTHAKNSMLHDLRDLVSLSRVYQGLYCEVMAFQLSRECSVIFDWLERLQSFRGFVMLPRVEIQLKLYSTAIASEKESPIVHPRGYCLPARLLYHILYDECYDCFRLLQG